MRGGPEGVRPVTLTVNDLALRDIANGEWRTHRTVMSDTARYGGTRLFSGWKARRFRRMIMMRITMIAACSDPRWNG